MPVLFHIRYEETPIEEFLPWHLYQQALVVTCNMLHWTIGHRNWAQSDGGGSCLLLWTRNTTEVLYHCYKTSQQRVRDLPWNQTDHWSMTQTRPCSHCSGSSVNSLIHKKSYNLLCLSYLIIILYGIDN